MVEGAHMAVDMKQVTLHHTCTCTHTIAARFMLYRCAIVKSTRPLVPAALAACSPIWALSCSSPADKRIHFLPCLLQRLLLLWEPQYSTERNHISQGLRKARVGPCGRDQTEKCMLQWESVLQLIKINCLIIILCKHTSKKWYIHISTAPLKIQGVLETEKSRQGIPICY